MHNIQFSYNIPNDNVCILYYLCLVSYVLTRKGTRCVVYKFVLCITQSGGNISTFLACTIYFPWSWSFFIVGYNSQVATTLPSTVSMDDDCCQQGEMCIIISNLNTHTLDMSIQKTQL